MPKKNRQIVLHVRQIVVRQIVVRQIVFWQIVFRQIVPNPSRCLSSSLRTYHVFDHVPCGCSLLFRNVGNGQERKVHHMVIWQVFSLVPNNNAARDRPEVQTWYE